MSKAMVYIDEPAGVNWQNALTCNFTVHHSTDVWLFQLKNDAGSVRACLPLLNVTEHERALRYSRQADYERFVISRAQLRVLLSKYTGIAAKQLVFETDENNKPRLAENRGNLHYNISHSGNCILIAVSDKPVGIDVEYHNHNVHYPDVMNIAFNKQEIDFVKSSAAPIETFYLLWTRKEALLKASGRGIDDQLPHVPCLSGSHAVDAGLAGSDTDLMVKSFMINDDYTGSLASANALTNFWTNG